MDVGGFECSAEQKWAESLMRELGICTNTAVLKQDLLSSLSYGGFEYIINYCLPFFAACSSTTAMLEVACATLPTLASVAGKSVLYTELLQPLWSVFHWIFVKLFLLGTGCVCECHQSFELFPL